MFVQKNVVNVNAYVVNGKFWIFVEGINSIEESLFVEDLVEPYTPANPSPQPPTKVDRTLLSWLKTRPTIKLKF